VTHLEPTFLSSSHACAANESTAVNCQALAQTRHRTQGHHGAK